MDTGIIDIQIEEEMKRSYLDYAMSTIVARSLPDARDGLKPVHRRILYVMYANRYHHDKPHFKSARIVGDVMGKYHPHGDSSIYEAMVRLARPWSMREVLVDGQGNFGSIDGDPPAAQRYSEARLSKLSQHFVQDLDKNTVEWRPNYDDTAQEPTILPVEFPNLLVNGASGIAVGMKTEIPTHNLGEVIDACCAYLDNPGITIPELLGIIKGPDFPTAGEVSGDFEAVYTSGQGAFTMRGKAIIEQLPYSRKKGIVITELPYQCVKRKLIEKIVELVKDKKLDGISDVRDESDRQGIRVVVEVRAGTSPTDILEKLYKLTDLEVNFNAIMLALDGGKPMLMSLKDMIRAFIDFRTTTVTRRLEFDMNAAQVRSHVLLGLAVAVINIDPILDIIKESSSPSDARERLMSIKWDASHISTYLDMIYPDEKIDAAVYQLSEEQATAILDLRLHRLTGLEREKIEKELGDLATSIRRHKSILGSAQRLKTLIKNEMQAIKTNFASPRLTAIRT